MTINQNLPTKPEGFEDRLLSRILENFDELTDPAFTQRARSTGRRGRSRRRLSLSLAVPAMAVAGVTALLVFDSSGPHDRGSTVIHAVVPAHAGARLTRPVSRQHEVLYRLAAKSLTDPALTGRYAILSEVDTETDEPGVQVKRTSVDDTLTGASVTYQTGYVSNPDAPPILRDGPEADETLAYFDALPTDPTALRAALLTAAKQQWVADNAAMLADAKANAKQAGYPIPTALPADPMPSDDDFVYQQASDILWSPVVPPTLRSALYKVLAGCDNVTINQHATDPSGRPAIEISQVNGSYGFFATYEDPTTGAVLAQQFNTGKVMNYETYAPVTSANTIPPDPYPNS